MENEKDRTQEWQDAQQFEKGWWMSIGDEGIRAEARKGDVVAGLLDIANGVGGSILDVGCGPTSLLLRYAHRPDQCVALDPIYYDQYEEAYEMRGIQRLVQPAEDLPPFGEHGYVFDEAWIYNCLQHVMNPMLIIDKVCALSKRIRIFEWVDIPTYQGHLHTLNSGELNMRILENGFKHDLIIRGNYDNAETCMHGPFYAGIYTKKGA